MTRPKLEDFKIENGGKFGYTVAMEKYTDYLERKTKAKPPTKTTTMNPNLKEAIQNNIRSVMFCACLWIAATSFVQRCINPSLTETQLLFQIPNNFILNFSHE